MATINVTYVTLFFVLKTISSLTRTAVYFLAAAMKTIYMNMKIGSIYEVCDSSGCPRSYGSNKLGCVIFTHNKSTSARPKKMVFLLPNDETKEMFADYGATYKVFGGFFPIWHLH